ncbi:hypothetical protein [Companilactobacillus furfuricola]|uniref:hypothetical protein n=1 Tax=Companilactobacillus furfuricola TaxID=1462575 RepID=UPI000F7A6577|nr:hypothetical protein [Companilactobacillus furfuricola]
MKLNKTDEKVLKYFIHAKGSNSFVDREKLKIPESISDDDIHESISVLEDAGLIKSFGKDYTYRIEPDGLRYFDSKEQLRKSLIFWKFVYPVFAFILGGLVNQFLFH